MSKKFYIVTPKHYDTSNYMPVVEEYKEYLKETFINEENSSLDNIFSYDENLKSYKELEEIHSAEPNWLSPADWDKFAHRACGVVKLTDNEFNTLESTFHLFSVEDLINNLKYSPEMIEDFWNMLKSGSYPVRDENLFAYYTNDFDLDQFGKKYNMLTAEGVCDSKKTKDLSRLLKLDYNQFSDNNGNSVHYFCPVPQPIQNFEEVLLEIIQDLNDDLIFEKNSAWNIFYTADKTSILTVNSEYKTRVYLQKEDESLQSYDDIQCLIKSISPIQASITLPGQAEEFENFSADAFRISVNIDLKKEIQVLQKEIQKLNNTLKIIENKSTSLNQQFTAERRKREFAEHQTGTYQVENEKLRTENEKLRAEISSYRN